MSYTKTAKNKTTDLQDGVIGYITLHQDDVDKLAIDAYLRVTRLGTGEAMHADRQTLLIRLHAGMHRLNDFTHEGADEAIKLALMLTAGYRPQMKKELRSFGTAKLDVIREALAVIEEMFSMSTLWEVAQAYKYAEDKCLVDSESTEYVLMTIH
jgi:hypothetical protein